jgi:dihydropteroate synthase-like protein
VEVPAEFVLIPDESRSLESLQPTIDAFRSANQKFRIDPILDPVGVGFAASLERYAEARRRWPEIPVMMGIGNVTELAEADTAGASLLLAGICGELGVTSVLTTEVANWCQSAVREFNIARRVIHFAIENGTIAKHIDSSLVMLRDSKLREYGEEPLAALASQIKDPNYRIFAERGQLHVMNRDGHWRGADAFEVFDQMAATNTKLSASHAFYLGYEMAKAVTALTLGKQYQQDEALNWGLLTRSEASALERRHKAVRETPSKVDDEGVQP